jgi:hypothetical protein
VALTRVVIGVLVATVGIAVLDKAGALRTPAPVPLAAAPVAAKPAPAPAARTTVASLPPDPSETPADLPDGPNREEAFYFCTACHGAALVRRQHLSRERWDELLSWMSANHNMPPLDGAQRERVLDYLAAALPPSGRVQRPNPFIK